MFITQNEKNLIIGFEDNPALETIVKGFNACQFDKNTKTWVVPNSQIKIVLDTLIPFGFDVEEKVMNDYKSKKLLKAKILRIKEGLFKPSEIELFEKTKLPFMPFQKIGTGFCCVTGSSLLADEPGCGKSMQSLAVTLIRNANKVLILCPATLKLSWKDEIIKWLPNAKVVAITGNKIQRKEQWNDDYTYYLATYESLLHDFDEMNKYRWDFIIADEATRITNRKAQQSIQLKKLSSTFRIAISGTPFNNKIEDIWNIIDFCQPNVLGDYWYFVNKFCIKQQIQLKNRFTKDKYDKTGKLIENGKLIKARKINVITGYKNLPELKKILFYYMIRRTKEEVLKELPPKLYETIYVEFTKEERNIYKSIQDNIKEELKDLTFDTKYLNDALVKMGRLKQVTGSLEMISNIKYSSKVLALKELLTDIIHDNAKVIIFTWYLPMVDILVRELKEYHPLVISGKVSTEQRNINEKLFKDDDKHKIMIMTEAGGAGLNLQRANYVIHYDLPWSISKKTQREDRAHRKGQERNVTIYQLLVKDSVDEYVVKVLHKKQQMAEKIYGDTERVNKIKITKSDIKKLLH